MMPIYKAALTLLCCLLQLLLPGAGQQKEPPICADGETMRICVPDDYMKFELPEEGEPTFVSIGVDIKDIPKVNDKDFSITINAYFIVKWQDHRLLVSKRNRTRTGGGSQYLKQKLHQEELERERLRPTPLPVYQSPEGFVKSGGHFAVPPSTPRPMDPRRTIHATPSEEEGEDTKLTAVNLQILRSLWLPDVEILNLKAFETHSVLSKLEGIWIDKQNTLMYALATRITFICPMKFNAFPMDIQICKFQVGSFNYDMSKMVFSNEFVPNKEDAIKSILDYEIEINDLRPDQTHYMALGMNYSVAGFEMVLTRKISFYVVTYYLPSGLFVVVSWISFLVNPEVIPGRMTLLVTIFLVLINIFNTIQTNSPKAEGLTAIEAWVIACIIFVFGALGEYTVILLKIKLKKLTPRTRKPKMDRTSLTAQAAVQAGVQAGVQATFRGGSLDNSPLHHSFMHRHDHHNSMNAPQPLNRRDNFGRTDLAFLIVFPLFFGFFNAFYWTLLYCWRWLDSPNS